MNTQEVSPDIIVVFDRELVGEDLRAKLVALLGDLVRAEGGLGVERVLSRRIRMPRTEKDL